MADKLLPCPFCGAGTDLRISRTPYSTAFRIRCDCGAQMEWSGSDIDEHRVRAGIIAAWDRRTRPEGTVTLPASALEHDAMVVGDLRQRIAELEARLAGQPHPSAVPEGWALVPVEPSASMVTAGCRAPTVQTEDSYLRSMVTCAYHAMVSAAPPAPSAWRPIAEAPTNETTIERWHRVWNCPVAVQRNNGRIPGYPEWITATKDQTWPEEAFTPHFRALSAPPAPAEEGGL